MLDNLTTEMGSKFGIGSAAEPLMREFLRVMTSGPGGLGGFLERFRTAGMSNEVQSYLGGRSDETLPAKTVDTVLGGATVAGISQRVGLAPAVVSNAAGFEIPKLIGMLTPGGRVPTALPNEVQSFVGDQVSPVAMATIRESGQVKPEAMVTLRDKPRTPAWLWLVLALALLGLVLGSMLFRTPRVAVPAVAPPTIATPSVSVPNVAAPTVDAVAALNAFLGRTVLNFATGSAALPADSGPLLQQAADKIKALPAGTVIQIAGHTDNVGNADSNMTLSQRRADAVRDALVQDGVNPAMLTATGYGQTRPIASNDTEDGRYRNRRIEFSVAH
jgi:outer membrane protein OmpA-like peptidoglycan-associated protein/uncharacterized protein YidB (DUF937 family)